MRDFRQVVSEYPRVYVWILLGVSRGAVGAVDDVGRGRVGWGASDVGERSYPLVNVYIAKWKIAILRQANQL